MQNEKDCQRHPKCYNSFGGFTSRWLTWQFFNVFLPIQKIIYQVQSGPPYVFLCMGAIPYSWDTTEYRAHMSCINHSKTATACCSIHATLGNWLQRAFLFPILTLLLHRKFNWKIGKTSKFKRISFRRLVWSNLENKPSMDGCSTVVLFISGRKDWRTWISLGGISGIWIFYFLCRWHTSVPGKLPVLNVSSFRGTHLIPSGFKRSEKGTY